MLQSPSITNWLGDVEPVWTLLTPASFMLLRRPPGSAASPIAIAQDLTADEIERSPVARNTLILLREAALKPGLKLTATGNLSRETVGRMLDTFTWPGFTKADAFALNKVVNEPDFPALFFLRNVAQALKLLRPYRGYLKITPAGRSVLEEPGAVQALLFRATFWQLDLSAFFGRGLHGSWPQCDVGVVLWSLSLTARDWQSPERLARLCTVPHDGVLTTQWDSASMATEATILRPLWWFGLLEHRAEDIPGSRHGRRYFYRKTPLFDRLLSFDVTIEANTDARH